ncbi:MAG: MFS transporter [Methanomicrobiales archaeon]|nr:MFS transporter [Methanomicrobiales archaeon]
MHQKVGKTLVVVMALGTFVVVLDNTIMNVSISALVTDLQTTVSGVQAAIALNALMMAAFVLMGGKMADITGMKKTFLAGALFYITGSLLASVSNNLSVFILGWCVIQGFGAAMMLPNVNTIIRAYITGIERVKAYGLMGGMNAVAMAMGPIIGGFLTTYFSWRWAFRLEVVVLLGVLLMSRAIPRDVTGKVKPVLDKVGVMWQAAAMVFFVLGTLLIADYGLIFAKQPLMIGDYAFAPFGLSIVPFLWGAAVLCLIQFVHHERHLEEKGRDRLIDLGLFSIKDFVQGLDVRFIQVALLAGILFTVPLFLQVTYGISAFETGFILFGLTAGLLLTAMGGAKRGLTILPKKKVEWGLLTVILGVLIMMAYLFIGNAPMGLLPGLFVFGLGMGLVVSQIVNLIMSAVAPAQTAEASGLTSTLETLGSSVGTAVIGTILVVALTSGAVNMVDQSTVFPCQIKEQISQDMVTSLEVVSTNVVSANIPGNTAYEAEAVRIYDAARLNAFIITLIFMAFAAFVAYLLARRLPAVKTVSEEEAEA